MDIDPKKKKTKLDKTRTRVRTVVEFIEGEVLYTALMDKER